MKAFFVLILLGSIVSVFYELAAGIRVMAHNHYEFRHDLLDPNKQLPDPIIESLELNLKDLSSCSNHVAMAYKESVNDGYRLGKGYNMLCLQCLALAALLFITSVVGIRATGKGVSGGHYKSNAGQAG